MSAARRPLRRSAAVLAGATSLVLLAGVAAVAVPSPLPPSGAQVNDDVAAGIDPAKAAGRSDLAAGATTAGGAGIPWAAFEQQSDSPAVPSAAGQRVFVRSFADGVWTTRGPALNLDPAKDAEGPAIDFAGANRTVPWVTWYEENSFVPGPTQIFASRFDVATNTWIPAGQARASGPAVPSLNINTIRTAENPAVAGGTTAAGANPEPWVAWEEDARLAGDATGSRQIFVSEGVKTSAATCAGFTPSSGDLRTLGGFCWQEIGIGRVGPGNDPSLNVDVTRDGVEPDIAFTGPNDTVPWVVWYEQGGGRNSMVFAAKAGLNPLGKGGFAWTVEGRNGEGVLAGSPAACAPTTQAERDCSLNFNGAANAEHPRVAAGTQTPGQPTVPWVVWEEKIGGGNVAIFVARLVNGRFELANGTQALSNLERNASRPDITFAGNVPYVTWLEDGGGVLRGFAGHFVGDTFVVDTPGGVARGAAGLLGAPGFPRMPIASSCSANPFTGDGATCPGGAAGSPAYLLTDSPTGGLPARLFAEGYSPASATTGAASAITATTARVAGSVAADGGPVTVVAQFGPTTAYGSTTDPVRIQTGGSPDVAFDLAGLAAGSEIHYRIVARGDFGSVAGADATFTTTAVPSPAPVVPPAPTAPDTRITKAPPKRVVTKRAKATVKVRFASTPPGATFQCRVKSKASFKACRARTTLTLRPGTYVLQVRARAGGLVDPTPAKARFRVIRR